jgi:glycine/serine hydroxymethyltransferase
MGETEVIKIVELIDAAIINRENKEALSQISAEVLSLCKEFPIIVE